MKVQLTGTAAWQMGGRGLGSLFTAEDYAALADIVFCPDYPGNATVRGVVEAPNGDPAARDTGKKYSHVAVKYLCQMPDGDDKHTLRHYLARAFCRAVDVALKLGVPSEFMPSLEHGALRVLEYPPGAGSHMHTDFDLFTLMAYRDQPEAFVRYGHHHDTPGSVPGEIDPMLHLGEIGELIGLGPATEHGVLSTERTQHSIVYFAIPDHAAVLPDHPLAKAAAGHEYPHLLVRGKTVSTWLAERLARSRYDR